jgi:HK97 family phage portal protein
MYKKLEPEDMIVDYFKSIFKSRELKRKSDSYSDSAYYDFFDHQNVSQSSASNSYMKNVVVYRCVNMIASAASHVPLEVSESKLQRIFQHPNKEQTNFDFLYNIVANNLLFGNTFIFLDNASMKILDSEQVNIVHEENSEEALGYTFSQDEDSRVFQRDQVLHIKQYNPNSSLYGLPCTRAAEESIKLYDMTVKWNNSLLANGARPSGALIVKDGIFSNDQFTRLRDQLDDKYTGSLNSGRPLLLEGGIEWKEMGINPKDMDFIQSKNSAARDIALAFGVPPQLLGIQGDNTYSNMQEARLALWEETIIPILDQISDGFSNWFSNLQNKKILINFNKDHISALTEKRQNLWQKLNNVDFMTMNEKRSIAGLEALEDEENT